ncbi:MAG: hypothetical protein K2P74_04495 [Nitrosomonas sp.]|nr:hypothetical protein [Nitrosomonas sp.]
MTSESTRKVIDQMNAANEEAKAQLMVLDSDKRRLNDLCERKDDVIEDLKTEIRNQVYSKRQREEAYEFTMILMILSLIFGFSAIGYAVWV